MRNNIIAPTREGGKLGLGKGRRGGQKEGSPNSSSESVLNVTYGNVEGIRNISPIRRAFFRTPILKILATPLVVTHKLSSKNDLIIPLKRKVLISQTKHTFCSYVQNCEHLVEFINVHHETSVAYPTDEILPRIELTR